MMSQLSIGLRARFAFDKFKLGAVRHKFVVAIGDHEQAQTGVRSGKLRPVII